MFYLHFCMSKPQIGVNNKQIISQSIGYRPQYKPSTIISPRAIKVLWLIMGSRVDTSGNNQNAVR